MPIGRHYGRFIYPGERPGGWAFHDGILLHGYWTWDWNDSYQTVAGIDTDERAVHLAAPHHSYGYTTSQRFAFCNVLEEVDAPGKWCFHRGSGRIYLWPMDDDPRALTVSVLRRTPPMQPTGSRSCRGRTQRGRGRRTELGWRLPLGPRFARAG